MKKFKRPKRGNSVINLKGEQVNWLLEGYGITLINSLYRLERHIKHTPPCEKTQQRQKLLCQHWRSSISGWK